MTASLMPRHPCKATKITKSQENVTSLKAHNKPPVTGPKGMEIQELPNKELKIILTLSGKQPKNKMKTSTK